MSDAADAKTDETEAKAEEPEAKAEEAKSDDAKIEDAGDAKSDESEDDAKAEDAKSDDAKADEPEAKDDESAADAKADESAADAKADESEPKAEEPKADEPEVKADETRASVLDLARGEVNDEDIDALELAISTIDFATRKATPEVVARLEACIPKLTDLVEQIRKGERRAEPEPEALSDEAMQVVQNLVDQGVSAGQKGNLEEARGYLEEAIQLNPDGIDCLFNLGVVYGYLAHHNIAKAEFYDNYVRDEVFIERAQICYHHLLELEPNHLPSLNNLATLYSVRDNREQAISLLQRIVGIEPESDADRSLIENARSQLQELETI